MLETSTIDSQSGKGHSQVADLAADFEDCLALHNCPDVAALNAYIASLERAAGAPIAAPSDSMITEALLAILGDFKSGTIDFSQAVEEIGQVYAFHRRSDNG